MSVHFSSKTDEWATPQDLFDEISVEFGPFDVDVCASHENAKVQKYFTRHCDGLSREWTYQKCWMNPPYGRVIGKWVEKAWLESRKSGALVVSLLPSRTDTKWFHQYIYNQPNVEIRFLKGRLKFGNSKNYAPFPSMVVIFRPIGETI